MNAITKYAIFLFIFSLAGVNLQAHSSYNEDDQIPDTTKYNIYTGKIIDKSTNDALPFASIESEGMNISTVSNIDGEFLLKIPLDKKLEKIKISYVGFLNKTVDVANYANQKNKAIYLEPTSINLEEVTIRVEDASALIADILNNIKHNYSRDDMLMTAFYRETIKKRRSYVSISEAVVDIHKSDYTNVYRPDEVKLIQGRKSADVEKMDTILFRIQGGPVTNLLLDIVKNPYILLTDDYIDIYNFYITGVISMNDKLHYVISFNQKDFIKSPYYHGKLYVDMERLAITEAEFELNINDEFEAADMFIKKKPIGLTLLPEKAAYRAKYTIEDKKWYFSYARGEVKFNVNWKKKLFNTSYTTMSEIAITDRSEAPIEKFSNKERFKSSHVLDELVYVFFDQDFWGSYNVIEPDQSIESAIKKLNRKYSKADNQDVNP